MALPSEKLAQSLDVLKKVENPRSRDPRAH